MKKITKHCLLLCPFNAIPAANYAASNVSESPNPGITFNAGNYMIKDGISYAVAGVYVTDTQLLEVAQLAIALSGFYYLLMQRADTGWDTIQALDACMLEQGLTRPPEEEL